MRTSTTEDIAEAYNIFFGTDTFTEFDETGYEYQSFNQETALIKRESFEKELTKEAKEVIEFIINCPNELLDIDVRGLTWNKIVQLLMKRGWSNYRLRIINKEIRHFLRTI
jgi:hypothetical protein